MEIRKHKYTARKEGVSEIALFKRVKYHNTIFLIAFMKITIFKYFPLAIFSKPNLNILMIHLFPQSIKSGII